MRRRCEVPGGGLRILGAIGLLAGLFGACDGDGDPKQTDTPDGSSGTGGTAGTTASDGSSGSGATGGDASEEFVLPEASSIVVRVGVMPVPSSLSDGGPGFAEETLAHSDVIAAGARAITIERRWDRMFVDPTTADNEQWQYLSGVSNLYFDAGRSLLLSLVVLDRTGDARPTGLSGAFNAPATISAVHTLIDRSFATLGSELQYLSIGRELDRYFAQATATERAELVLFVQDAFAYVRQHPSAPQGLKLGVSFSADGAIQGGSEIATLLAESDVAMINYHALDSSFHARPASSAPGDLDELWGAIGGDAGKSEIVLEEVAYPSSVQAGSSLEQQRTFFESLFVALLSRRERFPFVVVRGLGESTLEPCEADAAASGAPGDPAAVSAYCSFGLRTDSGDNKPAWTSVVDGLATFSSP